MKLALSATEDRAFHFLIHHLLCEGSLLQHHEKLDKDSRI